MTTRNQTTYSKFRYSWIAILDFVTWFILFYMVYSGARSLKNLVGQPSLGITLALVIFYWVFILIAGIGVTLIRHRSAYQVTFWTFLVNILIQLFVVTISSNIIQWKLTVFVILGLWFLVELFRGIALRNDTTAPNLISFFIWLLVIIVWAILQQRIESPLLFGGILCCWAFAEWLHARQSDAKLIR